MRAVYNTPREAFTAALFLTNCLELARFLNRQNQSVQVNAFYVYVCPTQPYLPLKAGSAWVDTANLCIYLDFMTISSEKKTNILSDLAKTDRCVCSCIFVYFSIAAVPPRNSLKGSHGRKGSCPSTERKPLPATFYAWQGVLSTPTCVHYKKRTIRSELQYADTHPRR